MKEIPPKHFHCYATANDSFFYLNDFKNLQRIKNCDSGVDKIFLCIAISKVRRYNPFDRIFVKIVKRMFRNHPTVSLMDIFHKTNVGRDFSSYHLMLSKVKPVAADDDYILFQNRSGRGPFRNSWYKKFIDQFEKFDAIALCGSSINFNDHPSRSLRNNLPHVQTYAFLSKLSYLNLLEGNFPSANETLRSNIITKGEIGLSQFYLEKNYQITCMEWPDLAITNQTRPPTSGDIKKSVTGCHCFYHRKYFKGKFPLFRPFPR